MSDQRYREEANRCYESAQDELDSGAILLMHKKHYHACFHAHQAILQALTAAWYAHNRVAGNETGPGLIRHLGDVDNKIFLKFKTFLPDVEKIERSLPLFLPNSRIESFDLPGIHPGKEFAKKDSEFFIDTAYKILAEVKTVIAKQGIWEKSET